MPGPGGYKAFGVVWEEGHEIPVGFSKKRVGFDRVTNNCAICHTATYREREDETPHVVVAAGSPFQMQEMLRFLFKAAHDPRFNADTIMNEIRLVSGNDYGNGGLSFIDRQIYRYLLIPLTRKALLEQEKTFTWMNRYVSNGQPKPDWGPGRDDAMNLTKYFMTGLPEDDTCRADRFSLDLESRNSERKRQSRQTDAAQLDRRHARGALGPDRFRAWPRRAAAAVVFAADGGPRSLPEQPAAAGLAFYARRARSIDNSPPRAKKSTPAIAPPATSRAENLRAKSSRSRKSEPTRNARVPGRKRRRRKRTAK